MSKKLDDIIKDFRDLNLEEYQEHYEQFEDYWKKVQENLSPSLIRVLKKNLLKTSELFTEDFKLQLEVVIDTNILYGEIYALLNGKPSFLCGIIDNPYLALYAPPEIKRELLNTIDEDLPETLEKKGAIKLAYYFLERIEILEGNHLECWNKAYSLIGKKDRDDVVFLSLAFKLETHGILSKDKVFKSQNDFKVWTLGECGRLVTDLTKGSFSFYLLDKSITYIFPIIFELTLAMFINIIETYDEITSSLKIIYDKGKKALDRIPNWIKYVIIGLSITVPSIILISSEDLRHKLYYFLKDSKKNSRLIYSKLKERFILNLNIFSNFLISLEPYVFNGFYGANYLGYLSLKMFERFKELEDLSSKV